MLLSTYNGARFLPAQIESLLRQENAAVDVRVRDDGSRDATLETLGRFSGNNTAIVVEAGANVGVTASFFSLLRDAPDGYDAYFFCDQDDVWSPSKICSALRFLAEHPGDTPALYCSRLRYVSESGAPLGVSRIPRHVGLSNALVESVAIGCTMAINGAARRLICERLPKFAIMHDWWCYLAVSAHGAVVYDPQPHIDYRQHGGNVVGAKQGEFLVRLSRKLRRRPDFVTRSAQAAELLRLHSDTMPESSRTLVELFVDGKHSLGRRIELLLRRGVVRSTPADQMLLSVQLAFNDY